MCAAEAEAEAAVAAAAAAAASTSISNACRVASSELNCLRWARLFVILCCSKIDVSSLNYTSMYTQTYAIDEIRLKFPQWNLQVHIYVPMY
jgi:hypothetical protein